MSDEPNNPRAASELPKGSSNLLFRGTVVVIVVGFILVFLQWRYAHASHHSGTRECGVFRAKR